MCIPSKTDWAALDLNDLEAPYIREHFFGKTLEEAEDIFAANALFYSEELLSMSYELFNFYAPALVSYLLSERARGDSDGASSFLNYMSHLIETSPENLSQETKKIIIEAAEKIAHSQNFYEASPEIYGNFFDIYAKLKRHV